MNDYTLQYNTFHKVKNKTCSVFQVYFRFKQQTRMGLVPRFRECSSWYAQSVQAVVQLAAINQLKIVSYLTSANIFFKVHMGLLYVLYLLQIQNFAN